MQNPIKRTWVPKPRTEAKPTALVSPPAAASAESSTEPEAAKRRGVLYGEIPEPEVEEKATESVWAAFNSVLPMDEMTKPR